MILIAQVYEAQGASDSSTITKRTNTGKNKATTPAVAITTTNARKPKSSLAGAEHEVDTGVNAELEGQASSENGTEALPPPQVSLIAIQVQ